MTEKDKDNAFEQQLKERLETLLKDELLSDISTSTTIEQVNTLIDIEKGHAYRITIDRGPLNSLSLVVSQGTSVRDIKRLIQTTISHTTNTNRKISWKYIWQSHCLLFNGQRLLNDNAVVSQLGISQGSILKFSKLAFEKGKHRRARKIR
ncbi:hypothetical protein BDC45DRAFT_508854 [Circinella umbellata]|nr:hypothetical protein BDC45DRAFT_508854 [Circinella umbellata]